MITLNKFSRRALLYSVCLSFMLISGAASAQALSGSYTIDPKGSGSTNYTSFGNAVSALTSKGVNGPVIFNVAPGTYSEQVTIPAITGASSKNTITFDGGGSSYNVLLQYNITTAASNYIWRFDGCSYVYVKHMTMTTLSKTYGWIVHYNNTGNYNSVIGCNIMADSTVNSTNMIGVCINGSTTSYSTSTAASNIYIDSCYINGGYYNIYNASSGATGLWITNNFLKDGYYSAVYVSSGSEIKVINNKIDMPKKRYTNSYGLYFINGSSKNNTFHEITGNRIFNVSYSGMTFHTVHNTSPMLGVIANNMVGGGFRNSSTAYGIFMNLCARWNVYHNTVVMDAVTTNTLTNTTQPPAAFFLNAGNTPTDFRNNNCVVTATSGTAVPAHLVQSTLFSNLNYNNYFNAADSTKTLYLDNYYSNVNLYGQLGWNKNSSAVKPDFVSTIDLHLTGNNPVMAGDPTLSSYNLDIDGDPRCPIGPTPGADEAVYSNVVLSPDFTLPDSVIIGSPLDLVNTSKNSVPVKFTWKYYGKSLATTTDFRYAFQSLGVDSIMLEMVSCYGTKTLYKKTKVILPAGPPKSNFVSDVNESYIDGTVKLSDLSTGGPSSWKWEVQPATYTDPKTGKTSTFKFLNGTDTFSQFPQISFNTSGEFSICLTASNIKGAGNKACKAKYVSVYDGYNMCGGVKKANAQSGYLFDEGGPTANYKANKTGANVCTFLIAPCNSNRTVLYFNEFDLKTGDYLRVYDGADASGASLYNHQFYPYGLNGDMTSVNFPDSLVSKSGKIFVQFESDNNTSTLGPGFNAFWRASSQGVQAPSATMDAPDTICSNVQVNFRNTTQGDELTSSWDFDGDGFEDAGSANSSWVFFGGGTYQIRLTVSGCGGSSTIYKDVVVIDPVAEPSPDFVADVTVAGTDDVVTLTNKTTGCGEAYSWSISPSTFKYAPGYSASSVSPKVVFSDSGFYTVTLTAANSIGFKAMEKKMYIKVTKFCKPVSTSYKKDIGISRVLLEDIDNVTDVAGAGGYTNYTGNTAASFERGASYTVRVDRPAGPNPVNRAVWIDFNTDGDFDDADEFIGMDTTNTLDISWSTSFTVPLNSSLGASRMRVAVVTASEIPTPCGPSSYGEYEDYRVFFNKDVTPPVITLIGKDTVWVEIGKPYKDAGATAFDNVDGNITSQMSKIDGVDTSVPDTNLVIYSVTDAQGNKTIKYRYVIVMPDDVAPTASLIGADTAYIEVYSSYVDAGVTYYDAIDGTKLNVIIDNQVDTAHLGTYRYFYYISDKTGNSMFVMRTVIVQDNTAPVASFTKGTDVKVEVFRPYLESDIVITDNYDSTFRISRTGSFNFKDNIPTVLDTFSVTYTITDLSGNTTTLVRNIEVIDTTAPVIRLKGDDIVHIQRWHTYTDALYTVSDNYYQGADIIVTPETNFVNTLLPGIFYFKYSVKDKSGNTGNTVTRIVIVDENVSVDETDGNDYSVNAYPNPTYGKFVIDTRLPANSPVRIALYDMNGREVKLIRDGLGSQPRYEVDLSAEAAGIYLLRVNMPDQNLYHKVVLVK